ncbi:GMC family oxidoreductase [Paracoccus aminophilus]|uniref:Glucose-methanol-choline oxidoreductase n=1 Tax=Paracoccus aminophilus JCM 7686 TaxID=1367847 RepID=S5XQX8_PARAH|nr:GMC family oxidoreductase [Paracoccus aminophilus]AGT09809.1 glucose-methanol-choline oxidoreductase [Paracoccus aminophilus JCM 7686]
MSEDLMADVVIIGSGVAGALVAAELAAAGVKVTILEAGAEVDRSEAVETYWNNPIKTPESAYPLTPEAMHPVVYDLDGYYQQQGPDKFSSSYIKVVGGTTWHWLGTALRFVPKDFSLKTSYGIGEDWPFGYDALASFYDKAEAELGVSGDASADLGSPRDGDYPMAHIVQTYLDKAFIKALEGSDYHVAATPQARNSVDGDRPACCGNNSCIPVCPIQAKYDATVHLDRAKDNGAQLLEKTTATSVEVDDSGKVARVHFTRWDGSTGAISGKLFLLAAHAIESPRLLLNSASERMPKGVANSSDQVGRNLMDHPSQLSWALSKDALYPYRGPLSTSGIENLRDGDFRKDRGAFRIEIGNDGWSWPTGAPITTAQDLAMQGLRGKDLDRELSRQAARQIRLASLVEQLPLAENRIDLDPAKKDKYGVPLPRIHFRVDDYTRNGMAEAKKAHQAIFERLGVTEIHHSDVPQGAGHIIGTLRAGKDAKSSVVDADLRSHDHANLFVAGSAVFPSSATANPTLTIAALSLRLAETMKAALKG